MFNRKVKYKSRKISNAYYQRLASRGNRVVQSVKRKYKKKTKSQLGKFSRSFNKVTLPIK